MNTLIGHSLLESYGRDSKSLKVSQIMETIHLPILALPSPPLPSPTDLAPKTIKLFYCKAEKFTKQNSSSQTHSNPSQNAMGR